MKGADEKTKTRLNLVLGDSSVDNVYVVHNNLTDTKISNPYYQYLFELQSNFLIKNIHIVNTFQSRSAVYTFDHWSF